MGYDIWQNASQGALRPDARNINPEFQSAMEAIFAAAPEDIRSQLGMMSAYRSIERQKELWEASDKSGKMVARPGHSQHNHGNAIDMTYASPEAGEWFRANAPQYGLNFPMSYEPWHVELAGVRDGSAAPGGAGLNEGGAGGAMAMYDPNKPHGFDPMQEKVMRGLMGNDWVDKRPAGLAEADAPRDETPEEAAARAKRDKWDRTANLFGMAAEFLA
jgi:hypothetical protein